LPALPIIELAQKSKERLSKNEMFIKLKYISDSIQSYQNEIEIVQLDLESFGERQKKYISFKSSIEQIIFNETKNFDVVPSFYDDAILQVDSHKKEINDELLKLIKGDIYIEEVYQQMKDLINLTKQ
jgi:hypothetical protein